MPTILSVRPLEGYKMEINFVNGNSVILNMANKLRTIRFEPLKDKGLFDRAVTDGESIIWNNMIEISTTEVFQLAQGSDLRRSGKGKPDEST